MNSHPSAPLMMMATLSHRQSETVYNILHLSISDLKLQHAANSIHSIRAYSEAYHSFEVVVLRTNKN